MRRITGILLLLLTFTGCALPMRLSQRAIVKEMGIDYQQGQYRLSLLCYDPAMDGDSATPEVLSTFSGHTLADARQSAASALGRTPFFGSTELIVLGAGLTPPKLSGVIAELAVIAELHPAVAVAYCKAPPEELLSPNAAPLLGQIETTKKMLGGRAFRLLDLAEVVESPNATLLLPVVAAQNDSRLVSGVVLVSGEQQLPLLTEQLTGVGLLRGNLLGSVITLPSGNGFVDITLEKTSCRIKTQDTGAGVTFSIQVQALASLHGISHWTEGQRAALEEALEKRLVEEIYDAINYTVFLGKIDPANFLPRLLQKTEKKSGNLTPNWQSLLENTEFHIAVNCALQSAFGGQSQSLFPSKIG